MRACRSLKALVSLLFLAFALTARAHYLLGNVVKVHDGDTITVAIAEAEAQLENKRVTRDEKVAALAAKTALVINGVIGNPAALRQTISWAHYGCTSGSVNPAYGSRFSPKPSHRLP